jgi:hypothetical protein
MSFGILWYLKRKNVPLPDIEPLDGLSAEDIIKAIRSFHKRFEDAHVTEIEESCVLCDFIDLLVDYPQSMLDRYMGDKLQLICALIYEEDQNNPDQQKQYEDYCNKVDEWEHSGMSHSEAKQLKESNKPDPCYSYDLLSLVFDRSKSTIHDAVKRKEEEVKKMLEEVWMREEARDIALKEMVAEEKEKLKTSNENPKENIKTNEQTVLPCE